MAMFIFPSSVGAADQNAMDKNAKIGLSESKDAVNVNAAYKTKKVSKYKKTYKKLKATYKKVKVTVRYKYKGKWRYKTV
jgi:hypothetical protein